MTRVVITAAVASGHGCSSFCFLWEDLQVHYAHQKLYLNFVKDYVTCQLLGGVIAGAIWQQNGFLREIGQKFPALNRITDYYSNNYYRDNYYNNYNSYNSYYGQQGYDQRPQYIGGDHNNNNNNNPKNGRTRVILPGVL